MRYTHFFSIAAVLWLLPSCKKFVDLPVPQDRVLASNVFADDQKALSALTAIYGNMINGSPSFANSMATLYAGYSSDELKRFNAPVMESELMNNALSVGNAGVLSLWKSAYQSIYYANSILEGTEASKAISPAIRQQLQGESRLIRAFCYFYLVNWFGDVPLLTTTGYNTTAVAPRTSVSTVYQQIITDIQEAASLLPATNTTDKSRPGHWAAKALLARVHLYTGNWAAAEAMASDVIESGLFSPLSDPDKVFLKNNKEAIWQLAPTNGVLREAAQMRPAAGRPQVILTEELLQVFGPADKRRTTWVDSITYQSKKYYYPAKYRNTALANVAEYYTLLRLSEQYLIRAEARARQNKAGAAEDIDVVRLRAGLPSLPAGLTQAQLLSAVEEERRRELFAEWGHRWLDLKRTGRSGAVLAPLKADWQPTDTLYPVPLDEIRTNPFLTQNKGY